MSEVLLTKHVSGDENCDKVSEANPSMQRERYGSRFLLIILPFEAHALKSAGADCQWVGWEPVWPSGKALGWQAERSLFYSVSALLSLQNLGFVDSDENHFNVSFIVRDKVTRQCPQTTTLRFYTSTTIVHHPSFGGE